MISTGGMLNNGVVANKLIPGAHPFEVSEYQPVGVLKASHQSADFPSLLPGTRLAVMETGVLTETVTEPSWPLALILGTGSPTLYLIGTSPERSERWFIV